MEIKFFFFMGIRCSQTIFTESSVVEHVRQNILIVTLEIRKEKQWDKKRPAAFLTCISNVPSLMMCVL